MYRNEYQHYDVMLTPKALTSSFQDFGVEINALAWNMLTVYVSIVSNNSTDIQIKMLGKYKDSSIWYDMPAKSTSSGVTTISTQVYEFSGVDPNIVFNADTNGVAFVKFQMKATGNTPVPGVVASILCEATAS
jgi:hypothetical protein